ncbi:hypothetical protein [Bradyrhizobium sp. UFLA05-112]
MAKSNKRQPIPSRRQGVPPLPPSPPAGASQIVLGYNPQGPKEPIDIVSTKEAWSEFTLADGTVLRAKAVVLDVRKMVDQYNQDGEPIYEMQLTMVNQARVPEDLKKKS